MDHVPQTARNPHPPVQVPYLVTDKSHPVITDHRHIHAEFEDDDDDDDIGAAFLKVNHKDESNTTQTIIHADEILSFYQARCFFGLLYDVYSVAGKQEDFDVGIYIDREGAAEKAVVTTKVLLRELDGIFLKERSLSDEEKVERFIEMEKCIKAAQNLTAQLQRFVAEKMEDDDEEILDDRLPQEIWVWQVVIESTAMLSETILSAARQIYLPSSAVDRSLLAPLWGRDLPPAPQSSFYLNRFKKAGWCPRDVAETTETVLGSRSVLLSLSSIDKTSDLHGNHEQCSEESCLLECIDNDTYKPLHAPDCEDSSCPLVPEVPELGSASASTIIVRIVQKGWIPVISVVEKPNSSPLLSIKAHQPAHKHDGPVKKRKRSDPDMDTMEWILKLCDPGMKDKPANKRNQVPAASGFKPGRPNLGDMAKALHSEDAEDADLQYIAISHVWAQGLGNRDINALPLCQLRRIQGFVDLMVPEHQWPMPFWIDTICVPLDPATRSMAIKEMRTVYRDASAVLVIDRTLMDVDFANDQTSDIEGSGFTHSQTELLMRIKASPWAQRLWTYHEAWLARELYIQISEADVPAVSSQNLAVPELEYTAGYLYVEAGALQLFGGSSSENYFREDLRDLSRQLSLRTTSRLQDEAICLSALLGLEAAAVMTDDHGKTVLDEDRMKRLWELLTPDNIPAEILLCNRPIYGDQGCGWMPRSLLRDNRGDLINHMSCGQVLKKHAEHGILVEMRAVCFEIPENAGPSVSPWNVVLRIARYKYRLAEVEASAPMPGWRSFFVTGNFAVLMSESELIMLLENVEERVDGSGSHSTGLPFGVLANVLESPVLQEERSGKAEDGVAYVLRREMVEFEIVLDDDEAHEESSDAEGDEADAESSMLDSEGESMLTVEAQVFRSKTRKWWVG